MQRTQRLTAIIEREDDGFVSLCPELDIASQGASIEEARANLVEALTLFFETADPSEVMRRYHGDVLVTQVEVPVGYASSSVGTGDLRDSRAAWLPFGSPARQSPHHAKAGRGHDPHRAGSASQSCPSRHSFLHHSTVWVAPVPFRIGGAIRQPRHFTGMSTTRPSDVAKD
jgi:predicted RNase H-like HicB family nuclease